MSLQNQLRKRTTMRFNIVNADEKQGKAAKGTPVLKRDDIRKYDSILRRSKQFGQDIQFSYIQRYDRYQTSWSRAFIEQNKKDNGIAPSEYQKVSLIKYHDLTGPSTIPRQKKLLLQVTKADKIENLRYMQKQQYNINTFTYSPDTSIKCLNSKNIAHKINNNYRQLEQVDNYNQFKSIHTPPPNSYEVAKAFENITQHRLSPKFSRKQFRPQTEKNKTGRIVANSEKEQLIQQQ